ncbi:hypothetical protein TNCV_3723181, partial [Trichonephila clavipes]
MESLGFYGRTATQREKTSSEAVPQLNSASRRRASCSKKIK